MFGRAPRGVSERPKQITRSRSIPSWLWLIVFVLAGLCAAIFLSLWSPWRPATTTQTSNIPSVTADKETNRDYKFYDLLPQQQVTPIPDQAVPEHQSAQPVVVVEAPKPKAQLETETLHDPFDEQYKAAQIPAAPVFILQIRSFEDPDSADAKRAEIVLNGLSAHIMIANEGKKVWYRVISGPYETKEAAHIAQQTLQNGGIDSIIVKQAS